MTIGEKIKYFRSRIGITQAKLAELSGIHPVSIRKYETNKMTPQTEQIDKIAEALGVSSFAITGFENNIRILEGDAVEQLKNVEGEFDMIFLDAAKGQYKLFYDLVIDKLKVGGVLISDNILYKGMIASDDLVVRRKKTIVKRMRNYLDYICNCDYLTTSLLPMGDGVAISYKDSKRGESENA